jgi:hypothetical protein
VLRLPPTGRSSSARRKRWAGAAVGAMAAAAAVVLVLRAIPTPAPTLISEAPVDPFQGQNKRPHAGRYLYGGAAPYRELETRTRGVTRGATGGSASSSRYSALAALERRGDTYGLAVARAWFGDNLADAVAQLRGLAPTPAIRNDLAAMASEDTNEANLEPILADLEALAAGPDAAVARAARWNHAILLARLELQRSAAAAFRAIAEDHEPGWSDEARIRARASEQAAEAARQRWQQAFDAGDALRRTGAPVSEAALRDAPGTLRAYFYHAVRAAPDADRVRALATMAAELDKNDGQPTLTRYVERVAKLDFRRRAPLAAVYARMLDKKPLTAAETRALTTSAPAPEVADIVLGAMYELDVALPQLPAFRALSEASGDRWFEIVLALVEADAAAQRGDWLGAEARLARAAPRCTDGVTYQCLELARKRGHVYLQLHHVPAALEVTKAGLDAARRAGEWSRYRALLGLLADIERFNGSTATARAYAGEALQLIGSACDQGSPTDRAIAGNAHRIIASAALLDVNGPAARRALEAAIACTGADLLAANNLADIGRLDPRPDDLARLRAWLVPIRARPTITAGGKIFADTLEARLQIESKADGDRAAGVAALEQAIAGSGALPGDVLADKARASAYSVLIFDAVRHDNPARAMALFARELGIAAPATCAVGLNAEDERAAVVVRGADGQDRATYEGGRRAGAAAPPVPEDLARRLTGCAHVQVMARAALQGEPRVLPAELAWSYAAGAHGRRAARGSTPGPTRDLVIRNVMPPPELRLAALLAVPDATGAARTLSGRAATPTRVLAEMRDASEIQFHTHALVDVGISDASHLVLSPDPDGRYALTAEAIRASELRGHPVVVLAACRSAQGARYQHTPWSLPDAFVAAGARAVFAAATDIPDRDAGAFFDRVLARVRAGADPATALRDERIKDLAVESNSWVRDVMLFE